MLRARFEKTGNAVWMSHLDLMRLFQRAFKRAGLHLKHTQGFNPRPSVSIALPLSVGVESVCELLDFEIEDTAVSPEEIVDRLNRALVPGVKVREVYEGGAKQRDLSLLACHVDLEYDKGIPQDAQGALSELFGQNSLVVRKRGKNGPVDQDIIPLIKKLEILPLDQNALRIRAVICCQNPALNPMQLVAAIEAFQSQYAPDFAKCSRVEVYTASQDIFR